MLKQRIITAVVLFAIVFSAIFTLSNRFWSIALIGLVVVGGYEWSKLSGHSRATALLFNLTILLSCAALLVTNVLASSATCGLIYLAVFILSSLFWLGICPIWLAKKTRLGTSIISSIVGWIILVPTWLALSYLQNSVATLILVFCFVWLMDSVAYFIGRKLGKHKLAPNISPKKTWEGVAAAYVVVTLYVLLIFYFHWEPNSSIVIYLAVAYFLAALSIEGDLFESWIKRQAGVKDSGTLLPGHGGVLDRIDSLTSTTPIIAMLLLLFPVSHSSYIL